MKNSKNKFDKYKHLVKPYFWIMTTAGFLMIIIIFLLVRGITIWNSYIKIGSMDINYFIYTIFLCLAVLIFIYGLLCMLFMNTYISKCEKNRSTFEEKNKQKNNKDNDKFGKFLNIFCLNKNLSSNIYNLSNKEVY